MRSVINVSLPVQMANQVEEIVSTGRYASKSEFFRSLLRKWLETKAARELNASRQELESGQGQVLQSLKDLR